MTIKEELLRTKTCSISFAYFKSFVSAWINRRKTNSFRMSKPENG